MEDEEKFAELRAAFNNLPRPPNAPDGASNHWEFTIHSVPGNEFDTLVHIFNPGSGFSHFERSERSLAGQNDDVKANWIVPLLMKAFLTSFDKINTGDGVKLFAPQSWGTFEAKLAKATEKELVKRNVRKELCTVKTGDISNMQLEQETWGKLAGKLAAVAMEGPKCQTCKRWGTNDETVSLHLCSACKKVYYCSKACQRDDWKENHKAMCKKDGESKNPVATTKYDYTQEELEGVIRETAPALLALGSNRSLDYFLNVAPLKPEVQALAERIKFPIPGPHPGLVPIIRRLVLTGEDIPENHAMLFGTPMDIQARIFCLDVRIEILLNPPSGSYIGQRLSKYVREGRGLDENWPWWTWRLRELSAEEKVEVAKIKKIQCYILEWTAQRMLEDQEDASTIADKQRQILEKHFGPRWKDEKRRFQMAYSTMDLKARIKELAMVFDKF